MTNQFETARLLLRQPDDEGYEFVRGCLKNNDLMKFVPGSPFSDEVVDKTIEWMKGLWRDNGFGHYVVIEKSSGKLVALINIRWEESKAPKQEMDLGFMVIPSHQRRGIVVEAIKPLLKFAFSELGAPKLTAQTRLENPASVRVLEKLGFRSVGKCVLENSVIGKQTYDKFELEKESVLGPKP